MNDGQGDGFPIHDVRFGVDVLATNAGRMRGLRVVMGAGDATSDAGSASESAS